MVRREGPRPPSEEQLLGTQHARQFPPHRQEHLGLDGQDHDVGRGDSLGVGAGGPNPVLGIEDLAAFRSRVAGDDARRSQALPGEQAGDHGFGHHAGADGGDGGFA